MKDELEELIESKKKNDKKQRNISLIIILFAFILLSFIFFLITQKQKTNEILRQTVDSTKIVITRNDSVVKQLSDTLTKVRRALNGDIIECFGIPTGTKTKDGLPKYNFTIKIKDTSLLSRLSSVDYYFNDITYSPKLKTSNNPGNLFSIKIPNSWGCMPIVPVYLHYKDRNIDTILFRMCDKARIILPKI
jgi:hypothetical protein